VNQDSQIDVLATEFGAHFDGSLIGENSLPVFDDDYTSAFQLIPSFG